MNYMKVTSEEWRSNSYDYMAVCFPSVSLQIFFCKPKFIQLDIQKDRADMILY